MKIVICAALAGVFLSLLAALIMQKVSLYLLGCGAVSFACFGFDKYSACRGGERLPENFLLLLCLVGGAISACLAMMCFRHKTRKAAFFIPVMIMAAAQAFLLIFL